MGVLESHKSGDPSDTSASDTLPSPSQIHDLASSGHFVRDPRYHYFIRYTGLFRELDLEELSSPEVMRNLSVLGHISANIVDSEDPIANPTRTKNISAAQKRVAATDDEVTPESVYKNERAHKIDPLDLETNLKDMERNNIERNKLLNELAK